MAFRKAAYWKSMAKALQGNSSNFTTSTSPKLKPFAQTADNFASSPGGQLKSKLPKGDYFPVFVAVGMITLSMSFGLYTVVHQMSRCPNVHLKKSRRETVPEVVYPDLVASEAEKFVKNSFFRKVAHIQDFDNQDVMNDPIRGDVMNRPVHVESLKDVGVDPLAH